MTNKDLDLPTQQELLAQFRCDEIAAGAFAEFEAAMVDVRRPVEGGKVVPGLGERMNAARSQALGALAHSAAASARRSQRMQPRLTSMRRDTTRRSTNANGPSSSQRPTAPSRPCSSASSRTCTRRSSRPTRPRCSTSSRARGTTLPRSWNRAGLRPSANTPRAQRVNTPLEHGESH